MTYDLLITDGVVLPLAPDLPDRIGPGFVGIRAGRIEALGPMSDLAPTVSARQVLPAEGGLVLPGLVNVHNHAAMTLFRGLADDLPLMTWLQEHIFPAEARFVNEEMVAWCVKLAAAEMILNGTTCVADGYFYEGAAAEAFCEVGLRAVAAQGVIDFPAPGVPDPAKNVATAASFLETWQGRHHLLTPGVFCHSPYTCGPETLRQAKALARERQAPFFIHVAETREEIAIVQERYGTTPVAHLAALGLLDSGTVCVHGIWLTERDIDLLAETGAGVAVCPSSNMKLASGTAPLRELLARSVPVGLGTDSCSSNNGLDLFKEMSLAAKMQKVAHLDPTVLPAAEALGLAARGGAALLGLEGIGMLRPGSRADLIVIDPAAPHLTPCYQEESLLVYAAQGTDVRDVIVDGRLIMTGRRLLTIDVDEVMARVNELARMVRG
jgi:5-methylthioadenosine/S-adenosylhomocysteine deaminase